jgi:4-amino-4-deoxy-L-arabinose transferase-like glycosyltransferase
MAIGFSTKGYIGVFTPGMFFLAYCFFSKNWSLLFNYRWIVGVFLFVLFISPVLIAYYIQYNLHPELVVRGENQINGVRFILWDQTLGRYGGEMGGDAKSDRLFFIHTFLWVFAPWSMIGLTSLFKQGSIKSLSTATRAALVVLIVFGILVGFSSFKLPHYINVILPLSAIWVADQLSSTSLTIKRIVWVEWLMWALVGVFSGLLLIWWFPEQPMWFWLGLLLLFTLLFYTIRKVPQTNEKLPIRISVAVLVLFWLLNAGFYRSILNYQGGTRLAELIKDKEVLKKMYSLRGCYSSSFYFNTGSVRKEITTGEAKVTAGYILYDIKQEQSLINSGIRLSNKIGVQDYEITKMTNKFLDPKTRKSVCTELVLAKLN